MELGEDLFLGVGRYHLHGLEKASLLRLLGVKVSQQARPLREKLWALVWEETGRGGLLKLISLEPPKLWEHDKPCEAPNLEPQPTAPEQKLEQKRSGMRRPKSAPETPPPS